MKTDIGISQNIDLLPIEKVSESIELSPEDLKFVVHYKVKIYLNEAIAFLSRLFPFNLTSFFQSEGFCYIL